MKVNLKMNSFMDQESYIYNKLKKFIKVNFMNQTLYTDIMNV